MYLGRYLGSSGVAVEWHVVDGMKFVGVNWVDVTCGDWTIRKWGYGRDKAYEQGRQLVEMNR